MERFQVWRGSAGLWQNKEVALGSEIWVCLTAVFDTPPKRLDMNPLGPRGVVFLGLGARAMERGTVWCLC